MINGRLTVSEAAQQLGLTTGAVRRASARGRLTAVPIKVGNMGMLTFDQSEVDRYQKDNLGNVGNPPKPKEKKS